MDYKAECQRIDAFELWCWRRLLRVPWTARRSNQAILKEISPGCSLEGLMLKLKLQYFGHLMQKADSFEKTLMLGKIEGRRRRGRQRMRWMALPTQWTWVWVDSGSWWWTRRPGVLWFMGLQRVGHNWATELNWTDIYICIHIYVSKWEEGSKGRGCVYTYDWFMLRFDRKQQNSAKYYLSIKNINLIQKKIMAKICLQVNWIKVTCKN